MSFSTEHGSASNRGICHSGYLSYPKDREAVSKAFTKALGGEGSYETEYRVMLPDGRMRWIASRGSVEFDAGGKPVLVRGAALDITSRKQAEEAAQDLSRRLIYAQEAERTRLARELHDDLSQSLALHYIELEMFGQSPPADRGQISRRMQEFAAEVQRLSSEVHRLSHELHPVLQTIRQPRSVGNAQRLIRGVAEFAAPVQALRRLAESA